MWRQDDLAVKLTATLGARCEPDGTDVDDLPRHVPRPGPGFLPACPQMHGTGNFPCLSHSTGGGSIVTLAGRNSTRPNCSTRSSASGVNTLAIVGDAFAKPILRALDAEPGPLGPLQPGRDRLVGRDVEQGAKQGLLAHHPGHDADGRVLVVGGARHGSSMSGAGADRRHRQVRAERRDRSSSTTLDRPIAPGSGEIGRLAVGGRQPVGYYKDEKSRRARSWMIDGRALFMSRRLRTIDADGRITLLGRGSVCINTGGEKVFPEEVEEAIKTHPSVLDAVVVGVPDEQVRRSGHRCRRGTARHTLDERELIAHVKTTARRVQGAEADRRRRHDRPCRQRQGRLQATAIRGRHRARRRRLTGAGRRSAPIRSLGSVVGWGMTSQRPVSDWTSDYDILDDDYVADPYQVWDDLRSECPVAHSDRWGGSWMPVRYADISAIAHDVAHFSSRDVGVLSFTDEERPPPPIDLPLPPIDADPPVHTWTRRLLLPWFSHDRVAEYELTTRELCNRLIDGFVDTGSADAAQDYAQQIPVRVIGLVLGVPDEMADTFTGWVRDVLEFAHDEARSTAGRDNIVMYLLGEMEQRRTEPGDDLISTLLHTEVDGAPIDDAQVMGIAALTLIAGVDTTWSGIGSAMLHLATHPEDARRLATEPDLMPTAIEELLRAYSPVTMARIAVEDIDVQGCPVKAGDKVLMNFPAANRDPSVFERPDEVVLDRAANRHLAFGVGIHRCAGSNLARMELRVAIEAWLRRIPEFRLADGAHVTWAGGQVRGPRSVPVVF